jgi:hypothetical protein
MPIIVGVDDQFTLGTSRPPWLAGGSLLADELGHGLIISRNDQFFTRCQLVDDLRQFYLRFFDGDSALTLSPP